MRLRDGARRQTIALMSSKIRTIARFTIGFLFVAAGVNHFVNPDFYVRIMPDYLPYHRELVLLSGVAEIAFGALALYAPYARVAGWLLVLLLVAVFPANIHMALHADRFPTISPVLLWIRLPLQLVFVWLVLWATRADAPRDPLAPPARES